MMTQAHAPDDYPRDENGRELGPSIDALVEILTREAAERPYSLIKKNGRLHVLRGEMSVYSPPDFLRPFIRGREPLHRLVDRLNAGASEIEAIMELEGSLRPGRIRSTRPAAR